MSEYQAKYMRICGRLTLAKNHIRENFKYLNAKDKKELVEKFGAIATEVKQKIELRRQEYVTKLEERSRRIECELATENNKKKK